MESDAEKLIALRQVTFVAGSATSWTARVVRSAVIGWVKEPFTPRGIGSLEEESEGVMSRVGL